MRSVRIAFLLYCSHCICSVDVICVIENNYVAVSCFDLSVWSADCIVFFVVIYLVSVH